MGVLIARSGDRRVCMGLRVRVGILQVPGRGIGPTVFHSVNGGFDGVMGAVGFGGVGQEDHGLGKGQGPFGKAQFSSRVAAGLGDDSGHRVGKADVL